MKQNNKRFLLLLLATFTLLFSGCEKDSVEEVKPENTQQKMSYVTIDEVPLLKPIIQKFKSKQQLLAKAPDLKITDLNLDLKNIIEYITVDGRKSYTITIREKYNEAEDYSFKNLHILEVKENYQYFVVKYNPEDDSKPFDIRTFTGSLEFFDEDEKSQITLNYNSGKQAEPAPPNPGENIGSGGDGVAPSWMPLWLADLLGYWNGVAPGNGVSVFHFCGCNGYNYEPVVLVPTPINMGTTNNPNTSGGTIYGGANTNPNQPEPIVMVPMVPMWPEFSSQHVMANLISTRITLTTQTKSWLQNANNLEATLSIYNYLNENNNGEANGFVASAVSQMMQNPTVLTSITTLLIEKQIDDSQLTPCAKNIVGKIKNLQQNDFAIIIAKLGGANSPYTVTIKPEDFQNLNSLAETYPVVGTNFLSHNIDIDSNYLATGTQLSIASTIIHEMIHSYFLSVLGEHFNSNNSNMQNDFPYLWNYYVINFTGNGANLAQHNQMATSYVNIIAATLQEYDTGVPVTSYSQLQQLYTDLAWGGLKGTISYETPHTVGGLLTPSDRTRISATNQSNEENIPVTDTTNNQTHFPNGTPCN